MHIIELVSLACAVMVVTLGYAGFMHIRKRRQRRDSPTAKAGAKMLPPDEFCNKVLRAKPRRMVILHVGDACATPGKGRRYEFRTEEPKSGQAFRTYFDDASSNGSGRPVRQPTSQNMRRAVGHIQLLMQAAEWHPDKRKGTLTNPAFYLES